MNLKVIVKRAKPIFFLIDLLISPLVAVVAGWLRLCKFLGLNKMRFTMIILKRIGIMPLVDHYYEPYYYFKNYSSSPRSLKGINFNLGSSLEFLKSLNYASELEVFNTESDKSLGFYYGNGSFSYGDADAYYSMIRHFQPHRIIEIGSGFSTLIAVEALKKNNVAIVKGELICIEPFEMPWLESLDVQVLRSKVEDVPLDIFETLQPNDILFIDSTHVIAPGGDVLYEFFEILPVLQPGVIVHLHDIFTPFYYPKDWSRREFRLWNEQYLLEAFLQFNNKFEVLLALQYLKHTNFDELKRAFPNIRIQDQPSSFWMIRNQ